MKWRLADVLSAVLPTSADPLKDERYCGTAGHIPWGPDA